MPVSVVTYEEYQVTMALIAVEQAETRRLAKLIEVKPPIPPIEPPTEPPVEPPTFPPPISNDSPTLPPTTPVVPPIVVRPPPSGAYDVAAYIADMKPGEFRDLPNTAISAVYPQRDDSKYHWGIVGPASAMTAWCGAALDTKRNQMHIAGEGHGDGGLGVDFAINLNRGTVELFNGPYEIEQISDAAWRTKGDIAPIATHTYQQVNYVPWLDKIIRKNGADYPSGNNYDARFWELDPETGLYKARANGRGGIGQVHVVDEKFRRIIVIWNGGTDVYYPDTDIYDTTPNTDWEADWQHYYGVFDKANSRILCRGYTRGTGEMSDLLQYQVGANIGGREHLQTVGVEPDLWSGWGYDEVNQLVTVTDGHGRVAKLINNEWIEAPTFGDLPTVEKHITYNGLFTKWIYSPTLQVFVQAYNPYLNVVVYKP